jgi:hypothetical protein
MSVENFLEWKCALIKINLELLANNSKQPWVLLHV